MSPSSWRLAAAWEIGALDDAFDGRFIDTQDVITFRLPSGIHEETFYENDLNDNTSRVTIT